MTATAGISSSSGTGGNSVNGWPEAVQKVEIPCSDGTSQPSLWYAPSIDAPKPLLVALHTWSSTYASAGGDAVYADWCIKQGWVFLHPNFRGANNTPSAMGSDRAMQDIVEAVDWARKQTRIDETRIYLVGVSGGGHMALQMAGRHPELWAAVSAWCGISDISQWHSEHTRNGTADNYAKNIEAVLNGSPVTNPAAKEEAWKRSPLSSLASARMPLDINHGIFDGRKGSVPFSHGLRAFNAAVPQAARLDGKKIADYYKTQQLPEGWTDPASDPVYGNWQPVFRSTAGNVRVTVFTGGHEIVHQAALNWLALQRKGAPAIWDVKEFVRMSVPGSESGK